MNEVSAIVSVLGFVIYCLMIPYSIGFFRSVTCGSECHEILGFIWPLSFLVRWVYLICLWLYGLGEKIGEWK